VKKISLTTLCLLILGFQSPATSQPASVLHEKPSLKEWLVGLKRPEDVTKLYKLSISPETSAFSSKNLQEIQSLLVQNQGLLQKWTKAVDESEAFWRGDIDDENVMNQVLVLQQLDFLRLRSLSLQKNPSSEVLREGYGRWFRFSGELAFEEASLIGLRLANLLRSLTLDEIEKIEKTQFASWAQDTQWLAWSAKLSAPWPVDRVILTEAKKIIRGRGMDTAQAMARALQKNTYQTAAQALKEAQGQKVPELQLLEPIWREKDIEAMKTEVNRIQSLRLRLAADIFKRKKGTQPSEQQQLVAEGLLVNPLVNYTTGKPFTLSEAAAR
jgi:hypothetical protein